MLVSWAVPKGPTLDPSAKRLAVHVEDHGLDYYDFEGVLGDGYGAGDVIVWDWGTWELTKGDDPLAAVAAGDVHFDLAGAKLGGRFVLVKRGRGPDDWLLLKKRDAAAVDGWNAEDHPRSVKTGRTNDEVLAEDEARRPASPATSGRPVAVVDIDGVVADVRHRLHHIERRPKDWDAFFEAAAADPPHPEGVAIVDTLAAEHDIVFVTGRPSSLRRTTEAWLDDHGMGGHRLDMRPPGDRRPAAQVKLELVGELGQDRTVDVVVDDDQRVLDALAGAGYATFAATWEVRSPDDIEALERAQEEEGRT